MSVYRESTYSINMRPQYDPLKFPQTVNTGDYLQTFPTQQRPTEVQIPNAYVNQTARSYAYELQLVSDKQVLSKAQQPISQSNMYPDRYVIGTTNQPAYQEINHQDQAVRVVNRLDIEEPWRQKCALFEKQIFELQQENQRYRGMNQSTDKVTYFEDTGRVNQLAQEIDRLNQSLIDLNQEIESWRMRYSSLEAQLKTRTQVELEIERMRRAVQDNENVMQIEMNRLREQLEEWQRRYQNLESYHQDAQVVAQKSKALDQVILNLQSDIKKLEISLRAKTEDHDALQQKFNRLERVVRDSEYQSQETSNLRRIIDERNREIEQLKQQQPQNNSKDLESKIALYYAECERLGLMITNKDAEINYYKEQIKRQSSYSNSRMRIN